LVEAFAPIDQLISSLRPVINISIEGDAFYHSIKDRISRPPQRCYVALGKETATQSFYHTLLHELAHWTGHRTRLARLNMGAYDHELYAREEMVAEAVAVILARHFGLTDQIFAGHKAYFHSWWNETVDKKAALKYARPEIERAVDYILVSVQRRSKRGMAKS
jgi:antirestriction protein ArdC